MLSPQEKINIFRDLFRGREDVFAMRWEKADGSASGYTPVCANEWRRGVCIKLNHGRCKDCQIKEYLPFSDERVREHLTGYKVYGVYPLLDDNVSYFVAVDFDGKDWRKNSVCFIKQCQKHKLTAFLERSRSGNGGHTWIFFADKFPAFKSRSIVVNILKEAKIIGQFDHEASFDRIFPNQDSLSGQGMGNLIALPLQGRSRKDENTVFLDSTKKYQPFPDQWKFLRSATKVGLNQLDGLYDKFNSPVSASSHVSKTVLEITIGGQLYIPKNKLSPLISDFLKENLYFANSEFIIRKKAGISVYGLEKYFNLIDEAGDTIALPRGFLNKLVCFLNEQQIKFVLKDQRARLKSARFQSAIKLFPYQKLAISDLLSEDGGILVAPPGAGKTVIGLDLIAHRKQPALILVHKRQIFNQWREQIENFLCIPKRNIGQICASKKKIGKEITIAMIQTLGRMDNLSKMASKFGLVLVDECHHIPAKMFRRVMVQFNPYYLYGLTATPKRKYNDEKLIFYYLGDIVHTVEKTEQIPVNKKVKGKVVIRETSLSVPFQVKTDDFQVLSKVLIFDTARNRKIASDIMAEAEQGKKCLVLTERKDHVDILSYYLKGKYEIIRLTGDLTDKQRNEKMTQINTSSFQIILATGQLVGEGTNIPGLDCLFLVFPFSFHGKLEQYIGRVWRRSNDKNWTLYDYRDKKIEFLEKLFGKRAKFYKKELGWSDG